MTDNIEDLDPIDPASLARIKLIVFGLIIAGALATIFLVEGGAMLMFGKSLPSYPSGWPLWQCAYDSSTGLYESNMNAMALNLLTSLVMIVSVSFVVWRMLSIDFRDPRFTMVGVLTATIIVFVALAWSSYELTIGQRLLGEYGLVRPLFSYEHALTHWRLTIPALEWLLRTSMILMWSCTVGTLAWPFVTMFSRIVQNRNHETNSGDSAQL